MINNKYYQVTARVLTVVLALSFLINEFIGSPVLKTAIAGLTVAMFIVGFPTMSKSNKIVCAILTALGCLFLFISNASALEWQAAILKGIGTMVLLVFANILSMPFFYKPYQEELKNVCNRYVSSSGVFLAITALISFVLGFYMSVAAIPLIYSLLCDISKQYKCHVTFVMVIAATNSLTMMCAPSVSAGVVPAATGISYSQMLTYGGISALILLVLTVLIYNGYAKKEGAEIIEKDVNISVDFGNVITLIVVFGILIGLILCINNFTSISLMAGISLLAIPFAFVMAMVQGKTAIFKDKMKAYYNVSMLRNPSILAITGICCFAGEGLKRAEFIKVALGFFAANPSLYLLFPLIIITVACLFALIGVHPHAIGAILAGILSPALLNTNPIALALMILIPWGVGLAINPYGATASMCSASSGLEPKTFTSVSVWKWAVTMIVVGSVICDVATLLF